MIRVVALALALVIALAGVAGAGTRRVAIVVGNNVGNGDRPALQFAEVDASKFADVLRELGGVAPDDLFLLRGSNRAELDHALAQAKQHIAAFRKDPTSRVVVLFYFSGHSDGEALELGTDRLTFGELRHWLAGAGADVRVALVDSCKSGALLAVKGGTRGPAFQIRLTDDVASTGEALLTSSASDEVALESSEIGGSFFTHHFISGLRGAADTSGDGIVTLNEAYQYAYAHTIRTTGETVIGPQHPAYDYRLSGQGELVLAELTKPTASLALPAGFDRILISTRDQVVAELSADARDKIAVQPGTYTVRAWRGSKVFAGRLLLSTGEQRVVRADELAPTGTGGIATITKGGDPLVRSYALVTALGVTGGIADGVGARPGVRAELVAPNGLSLGIAASARGDAKVGPNFRETTAMVVAGYRRGVRSGELRAWAGVEAGPGFVLQNGYLGTADYSFALVGGIVAGAALAFTPRISLVLTPTLDAAVLRRDGKLGVVPLPTAWLGLAIGL